MGTAHENLRAFLQQRMRMSHLYQPLMLKTLLQRRRRATVREIAAAFLAEDQSQLEYYEAIVRRIQRRMPRISCESAMLRSQSTRRSVDVRFGSTVHRAWVRCQGRTATRPSNARGSAASCAACQRKKRALDVDHIQPRKHGGPNTPENLQALCWLCNTNKGAGDATDFRAVQDRYGRQEAGCLFCHIEEPKMVATNSLAIAIRDGFPVTPHHTLVLPKRHVAGWFDLYRHEKAAIERLLDDQRAALEGLDPSIAGFNVGINAGEAAGQTIFHCHVHLIPRRTGDVENPRGGVRHVIPRRGVY